MPEIKIVDETHAIPRRRGNGKLRREIWENEHGEVTRYNLAYINRALYAGDNGRVIGFDNAHDGHHCHRYGQMQLVVFVSFEDTEAQFQSEWRAQAAKGKI